MIKKTKQEVVTEFRCSEILAAARKVFAKKGFNDAKVDDIAEAASLAKGTIYLYFPSKREIYFAALKEGVADLIEATNRELHAAGTLREKVRAFIATRVHYAEENKDFCFIYHAEFGNIGNAPHKEMRSLYVKQQKILEDVLREGVEKGEMRPIRTDAAAYLVYEMTRSTMSRRTLGWSTVPVEEDIDFLFDMVWRALEASPNGKLQ